MASQNRIKENIHRFDRALFRWHQTHYRPMRWRATLDPYRILVSEVMLQQTQVSRVKERYDGFLKAFPTVHDLATAPLGEVLKVWSGLGYNRRAKYLHLAAKTIIKTYNGIFPSEREALLKLPGVGPSTAAALQTFAFGKDEPMIDTNIRRVLRRALFGGRDVSDETLYDLAKSMIPRGKGREWNYAMLDLGAISCKANGHDPSCPIRDIHGPIGRREQTKKHEPFERSKRFVRGRIMKYIARAGVATDARIKYLKGSSAFDPILVADELVEEGLLRRIRRTYRLP